MTGNANVAYSEKLAEVKQLVAKLEEHLKAVIIKPVLHNGK